MFDYLTTTVALLFIVTLVNADNQSAQSDYLQSLHTIDRIMIGGQPQQADISKLQEMNVSSIINLRTDQEMNNLPFDEKLLAKEAGITYQQVAIERNGIGYTPENLKAFADAIASSKDGLVLLHCRTGKRVKQLYMAYLIKYKSKTPMQALEIVQPDGWPMPLEQLLGEPLTLTIEN